MNNAGKSNSDLKQIPQNKEHAKRKNHVDYIEKVGGADE